MTCTVLICDDHEDVCGQWVEAVRKVAPAERYRVFEPPGKQEVREAVQEVFARQCAWHRKSPRERGACMFDDADILVLDYDLLHIDEHNARHTGESLARLARLFTTAGVVVVVNQFGGVHFDLSLRGHLSSHADLNLDADLLDNRGLWTDPPWDGFRPWHWQVLCRAVETQAARENVVRKHFDNAIVEVLGMEEADIARLSDTAFGFIAPKAGDWKGIRRQTFRSFASRRTNGRNVSTFLEGDEEAA